MKEKIQKLFLALMFICFGLAGAGIVLGVSGVYEMVMFHITVYAIVGIVLTGLAAMFLEE